MKKISLKSILNPFSNFTDNFLRNYSIGVTLLFSGLAVYFNARFDGILDTHFVDKIKWYEPFLDNIINTFSLTITLILIAKIIKANFRWQDLLITTLWSRMAFYPLILLNINDYIRLQSKALYEMILENPVTDSNLSILSILVVLFFAFLALASLTLFSWWLWHGFTISTNKRGIKVIILLFIAALIAEILSKSIIINIV